MNTLRLDKDKVYREASVELPQPEYADGRSHGRHHRDGHATLGQGLWRGWCRRRGGCNRRPGHRARRRARPWPARAQQRPPHRAARRHHSRHALTMSPALRKLVLTAHVACSVGWLGAVAAFMSLAVAGLASDDLDVVRGAYLTMELTGWFVVVPLALASLVTGLVQSLGTNWGLFLHYWVFFKLAINI